MCKRLFFLLVFAITSAISAAAQGEAGPLGLRMGMPRAALERVAQLKPLSVPGTYSMATVPSPHPSFESYTVVVSPARGLCKVVGVGKNVQTSVYGDGLRSAFDGLREAVQGKYGQDKKFDFLRAGSIWDEPRDWMMSLLREERYLTAFWDRDEGSNLPADISAITLEAVALQTDTGYLRLVYEFSNYEACSAELKSQGNNVL